MGSLLGASAGASGGSLLEPGCGSVGFGSGGVSSGGASAPSVICAAGLPVLPSDLLVPGSPSFGWSESSSTLGKSSLSSVSLSRASLNYSLGLPLPLPVPVNVAAAMPTGRCNELPPHGVCFVFTIL